MPVVRSRSFSRSSWNRIPWWVKVPEILLNYAKDSENKKFFVSFVCFCLALIFHTHTTPTSKPRDQQFFQFSRSVVSDSLQPRGMQHARPPWPSPTPRACRNSCPSSWWCYPNISSSVVPFSSCLQSFPASRSFPMSQFFTDPDLL